MPQDSCLHCTVKYNFIQENEIYDNFLTISIKNQLNVLICFLFYFDFQLTFVFYFLLHKENRGVFMEVFANVLSILKYLVLATVGSAAMCFVVSLFGGLLEKLEGNSN